MPRKHRPLSHSARETYKGCNRQFFFSRELGFEPIEKKKSQRMGTAFGLCIEHRDPDRAAEGYWDGVPLHERVLDRAAELEIAQVTLLARLYCERYPDHQTYSMVEHEVEFRSAILGHGFLDGVFERTEQVEDWTARAPYPGMVLRTRTERVGMEGKLLQKGLFWNDTSRLVLAIDDQVTAYFAAMREIGRPLDKLLYRVTFKPGITQSSTKKETLPAYLERLEQRIADDPAYAFEEHALYRTDAELDEFLEECADVNEQVKLARRRGAWPKNTKNCTAFGGCQFLPLCRNESGAEDLFRVREPKVEPKLPRLGKVQKAVLLAMGDAFTPEVELEAVGRQVAGQLTSSIHSATQALVKRGFVVRLGDDGDDPTTRTTYALTDEGRGVYDLLQAKAASDATGIVIA